LEPTGFEGLNINSEVRKPGLLHTTLKSPLVLPIWSAAGVVTFHFPAAVLTVHAASGKGWPRDWVSMLMPLSLEPVVAHAASTMGSNRIK
jgi:hypothetical protein